MIGSVVNLNNWPFQPRGVNGIEINASIVTLKSVKEKKMFQDMLMIGLKGSKQILW